MTVAVPSADPARVIAAARLWIGTPFHHQASLCGAGCDCLGLVRGIWASLTGRPAPLPPPYDFHWADTAAPGAAGQRLAEGLRPWLVEIDPASAGPGALLLFARHRRGIARHAGLLTAPDKMLHADARRGVVEDALSARWRRSITFAFLFPAPAVESA